MKALREAKAWLDREWPASIIGSAPPSVHILAALVEAVDQGRIRTLSRSDVDALNLPESWSHKRVRVLAVGEE